jgi:hypothetical protein
MLTPPQSAVSATSNAEASPEAAHQLNVVTGRLNDALAQNVQVQRTLTVQSSAIASLQSAQVRVLQQMEVEHQSLQDVQRQLSAVAADSQIAATRNTIATVLNIVGMIFGILGGVLLAGAQLAVRQERIADLRATRSLVDLALQEKHREPILNFFGLVGSIAISLGFVLQFIGALVTAPLPWAALVVAGVGAFAFVGCLISFFLGYTPDQTRVEKTAVVIYNLRRHIGQPIWRFIFRRRLVACQVCLRKLTLANAHVWWLYEDEVAGFPYLHQPYNFHYGHEECLPNAPAFGVYFDVPGKHDGLRLGKASVKDFLGKEVPKFRNWYVGFHRHWTAVRQQPSEETAWEEQLNHVEKDISGLIAE